MNKLNFTAGFICGLCFLSFIAWIYGNARHDVCEEIYGVDCVSKFVPVNQEAGE